MIRTAALAGPYNYISRFDPAVDRPERPAHDASEEEIEAYRKAVVDFEAAFQDYLREMRPLPPLKEGQEPTVFRLRHLSTFDQIVLTDLSGGNLMNADGQTLWHACRMALITASNIDGEAPEAQVSEGGTMVCPAEFLEMIHDPAIIYDIARRAVERRLLDPT